MARWIKTPAALTPDQIKSLYAMAERFGVGVITGGGSGSPSRGPAEWSVNGGWRATAKFLAAAALAFGATKIAEPSGLDHALEPVCASVGSLSVLQ